MGKISNLFKALSGMIGFKNLSSESREVTFYSEGKNYWPHLKGLVLSTLENTDTSVCYVSSSLDDPGLQLKHPRLQTFFIGAGFIRDYFFQTLETKAMVMTMPDLNNYQVKKSGNDTHYIYVQHSLVSLHMIYRHKAFDHFDTICCSGTHHVKEVRAIERKYNLPSRNILELGYSRLDSLINNKAESAPSIDTNTHVLIAPSWGPEGLIESGLCMQVVDDLISNGYKVTLRPHPQTTKFASANVKSIVDKYISNELFSFEDNVAGENSLYKSNVMISDWSGAALEYALGLNKPVIFCDVPRKVNNPNYQDIPLEPIEVSIRDQVGIIWDGISPISESIPSLLDGPNLQKLTNDNVFNCGYSDKIFADFIKEI